MKIVPYPKELEPAVDRFNSRLKSGGKEEFMLPERWNSEPPYPSGSRQLKRKYYLAVDDSGEVRGGYIIRNQPYCKKGSPTPLSFLKLPVSEGAIDSRYATVGLEILMDAVRRCPSLFALGMGGIKNSLPRVLKHLEWEVVSVPFFFKIRNPSKAIRTLAVFQSSIFRKCISHAAIWSGLGRLASTLLHPTARPLLNARVCKENQFGSWADEVWEAARCEYGLAAERSSTTLPEIFAPFEHNLQIFRVTNSDNTLGWSACLVTEMKDHQYFGNMKVATLADGLAPLEHVSEVIQGTLNELEKQNPDIIISNQLHQSWQDALLEHGFRSGPSNFALAVSPSCEIDLSPGMEKWHNFHINRGDGDGPIHL